MRRIIIATTALAVLVAAGVAFAAGTQSNTYTGTKLSFAPSVAGSAAAPAPISLTEALKAGNATAGLRAAPLTDIKLTIYGLTVDSKDFPTCSATTIGTAPKYDAACNPKALVANGSIVARLGDTTLTGAGAPCTPVLHVWNSGGGKVTFFFISSTAAVCASVLTGKTAPYVGTIKQVGANLVQDTPLPADVSTEAGGLPGVYGSLESEHLTWSKLTTKVKGKTVGFVSSVACKKGSRPWTVSYTAVDGATTSHAAVTGSSKC